MGKSQKQKMEVTEYRMSIHFGVGLKMDAITGVYVNQKEAWSGRSETYEEIRIERPELFGGQEKEGGLDGYLVHYPGSPDQIIYPQHSGRWGLNEHTSFAYRGVTTIMLIGGGVGNGFVWGYNNPVIAQEVWIKGENAPVVPGLNPAYSLIPSPVAGQGPDANPAHIIYECMTDANFMGSPTSMFHHASWNAAAQALYNEQFGLSLGWAQQGTIEEFCQEVQDHIQAMVWLDQRSGLWKIKLLRDDYSVIGLRHLTPDNANLTGFSRRMWGEAVNEIAVSYTSAENEEEITVTYQDLGSIAAQGEVISDSRNYYGVRSAELAMKLAQRDVRTAAAPLASATAIVDRSSWDVEPGEVILVSWPEKDLASVVFRVMGIDLGSSEDGKITLSLLEDIFSLERPPLAATPGTGWVDPGAPPEPMTAVEIFTLPAYFSASADFQAVALDLEFGEVLAATLGYQEQPDVIGYNLLSLDVTSTGNLLYVNHGAKAVTERAILQTTMPVETTSYFDGGLILNKRRQPEIGGFIFLGAGSDAAIEIAQVVGYEESTDDWILARGVLDTVPRAHTPGSPAWIVNPGDMIVDDRTIRSAGEEVHFKLLTRSTRGVLPQADAATITETLTARPHLPNRPANVKINGSSFGPVAYDGGTEIAVTWATRNRTLEDGIVYRWTDGPVAPEHAQGTVVRVFDNTGTVVYEETGLWTQTERILPAVWFYRYPWVRIEVSARRQDLDAIQAYSLTLTGLPADPGAPPPPPAPDNGPPPNVDPAPAEGAWAVTGVSFVLTEAGKVLSSQPAIVVSGVRDRPDAIGLTVRYKKAGSNDWFYLAEVALDDNPTQSATTAVSASTTYRVEVAYRSDKNVLSMWRDLGEVTTGLSIVQQLGDLTEEYVRAKLEEAEAKIAELLAVYDEISEIVDTFPDGVVETITKYGLDIDANAEAIIERSLDNASFKAYTDLLTHVDGVTVKSALLHNVQITDALVATLDVIIVRDGDLSSSMVRYDKVSVGEGETLAQALFTMQSAIASNTAEIVTNYLTLVNADEAIAASVTTLGSNFDAFAAQVAITYVTQANLTSSLASYDVSIKAWVNTPSNPLQASVTQSSIAIATLQGNVYARYVLEANAGGNIARMTLLTSGGAVPSSIVRFESDNFFIGAVGGGTVKPFFYNALTGTLYTDTITVRNANIENASITRLKIAGGSVTAGAAASGFGEVSIGVGGYVSLISVGLTSFGGRIRQNFSCYLNPVTFNGGAATQITCVTLHLRRNGAVVRSVRAGVAVKLSEGVHLLPGGMLSFIFSETPGAAGYTYDVVAEVAGTACVFATPDLHCLVTER